VEVLSGKILDPTSLAEAGMEVPNPYPLTRAPGCPHMSLYYTVKGTLKTTSSDPNRQIPSRQHRPTTPHAAPVVEQTRTLSALSSLACSSSPAPSFSCPDASLPRSHGGHRSQLSPSLAHPPLAGKARLSSLRHRRLEGRCPRSVGTYSTTDGGPRSGRLGGYSGDVPAARLVYASPLTTAAA
jgi:hypothetical protein